MTTSMRALILRGNAAHLPLPDASVDLIVTSPPYFGLRSYTDGGEHYDGQIGNEATPRAYLEALWSCTAEWVRVLKPSGSLFVNLGDKYAGSGGWAAGAAAEASSTLGGRRQQRIAPMSRPRPPVTSAPPKSLLGMPWRYALGCVDDLGLILRAEIVWAKPNGLPESVTDRVRRAHEQVFHFTRQPRYYSAVDEVREAHVSAGDPRWLRATRSVNSDRNDGGMAAWRDGRGPNPLGKLPGSVWSIPSAPLTVPAHLGVDHFAAYPPELVRRIILGWSPAAVCTGCGEGRRPVTVITAEKLTGSHGTRRGFIDGAEPQGNTRGINAPYAPRLKHSATITGYACACPDAAAPATPGIVLDPFAGTGTTMLVASVFGRTGIGIDRSADYCRLAQWRCSDPGERARALDMPKPPPVADGQEPLF